MQRAGVESILGLRLEGAFLRLEPCIPNRWPKYEMTFRYGRTRYQVVVENPDGVSQGVKSAHLDGTAVAERPLCMPLVDDGRTHDIRVRIGPSV